MDEGLVVLVAAGVGEADQGGDPGMAEPQRPQPQPPEQAVLGGVDQLAADEVEHAQARVQVGLRGQEEDRSHHHERRKQERGCACG